MAQMKPTNSRADRRRYLGWWFAMEGQLREFPVQSLLGLPGDLGDAGRQGGQCLPEADVEPGAVARVPGCLAEHVSEVRVAGSGDAALGFATAARVFRRNEACVAHELGGLAKALKRADLGDDGDRCQLGDAAQSLQSLDDGLLLRAAQTRWRDRWRGRGE